MSGPEGREHRLRELTRIELPGNRGEDGFDHAAVSVERSLLYVAHTANDAVDIIDCAADRYLGSIEGLAGVAGALVSDRAGLVFTSNRGEDTVGILRLGERGKARKVRVGSRPNGLAFDPGRGLLYVANVGESPAIGSHSVTVVDVARGTAIRELAVPGRTRWAIYDPRGDSVYVNIREPACIAVIDGRAPDRVARTIPVPAIGPHGLDLDPLTGRLLCACDDARLLAIDPGSGRLLGECGLSGAPDVVFVDTVLRRIFVASGSPGVLDVIHLDSLGLLETVATEQGAHTFGYDQMRHKVYAFMPDSHRALVLEAAADSHDAVAVGRAGT